MIPCNFLEKVEENWNKLMFDEVKFDYPFVPLKTLIRGQDEIAYIIVFRKYIEHLKSNDIDCDGKLYWDNGNSIVPSHDPIEVIKYNDSFVIIDGHHDFYLSLYVGAKTISIKIIDDLSYLNNWNDVWNNLGRRNLTYFKKCPAELKINEIGDNANRFLASLLVHKVGINTSRDEMMIPDDKAWLKIGNGEPFIEFKIGNKLKNGGIIYDPCWTDKIPLDIILKAKEILK